MSKRMDAVQREMGKEERGRTGENLFDHEGSGVEEEERGREGTSVMGKRKERIAM